MELTEYDITFQNRVSSADPLHFDARVKELTRLNDDEDLNALINLLKEVAPEQGLISDLSMEEKLAAMRDLGMVISSIRKLGTQPLSAAPELEPVLLQLADDALMPPRDTAYHYGVWNPEGERQRTFTTLKDEWGLIHGVRLAIPACENAAYYLIKLRNAEVASDAFGQWAEEVQRYLKKAVEGIAYAIRVIDPWIFSHKLRPFFNPIEIDGKSYIGPGGGQMPLYLFDRLLWFDGADEAYTEFIDECNSYMPEYIQRAYNGHKNDRSLLNLIEKQVTEKEAANQPGVQQNLHQLDEIFKILFKFRKPHENLAKRSLSKENRGDYDTGSAGYQYRLVKHIYDLNKEAYAGFSERTDRK